jgi:hypothetical protein
MFCLTGDKKIVPIKLETLRLNGFIKYLPVKYPLSPMRKQPNQYVSSLQITREYIEPQITSAYIEQKNNGNEEANPPPIPDGDEDLSNPYSDDEGKFAEYSRDIMLYKPPPYIIDLYYDGYFGQPCHINDVALAYIHGFIISPFILSQFKITFIRKVFIKFSNYREMIMNIIISEMRGSPHINKWIYSLILELIYVILETLNGIYSDINRNTLLNYLVEVLDVVRRKDMDFFDIFRQVVTRYLVKQSLTFTRKYNKQNKRVDDSVGLERLFVDDDDGYGDHNPTVKQIGEIGAVYSLSPARAYELLCVIHEIGKVFNLRTYNLIEEIKKELMKMKPFDDYTNEYVILGDG